MGGTVPKQYLKIHDKTILEYSVEKLMSHRKVKKIVVALHPDDDYWPHFSWSNPEKIMTTIGGKTRSDSVLLGLEQLTQFAHNDDWVLVHDAVRPCVTDDEIDLLIKSLAAHPVGGLLGLPLGDTLKEIDETGAVCRTINRSQLWCAKTPQMFRFGLLYQALTQAKQHRYDITDEASAIELMGKKPMMIQGEPTNIKVTYPQDLNIVKSILAMNGF